MPTTTVTTGALPPAAECDLTVRQRTRIPDLAEGVRGRILELDFRGKPVFTLDDFQGVAALAGRPESWVNDHLMVLEGIGVLRRTRAMERTWTVVPSSEYLR